MYLTKWPVGELCFLRLHLLSFLVNLSWPDFRWGLEGSTAAGFFIPTHPPADGSHSQFGQVHGGKGCQDAQVWFPPVNRRSNSLLTRLRSPVHVIRIVSGVSGLRYRASCLCYTLRSQTRRSTVSSSWSTASLYPTWTPRHPPQHWRYVWYRPFVMQLSTNIERIYWDWRSEWWWKLQSKNIWGVVETGESLGSDGEVKGEDWGMLEGSQRELWGVRVTCTSMFSWPCLGDSCCRSCRWWRWDREHLTSTPPSSTPWKLVSAWCISTDYCFFNKLKALKLRCTTLWAVTDAVVRNLCSDSDEDTSEKSTDEDHQRSTVEDLTDVHFKFEVKEVCVWLSCQVIMRPMRRGCGVLVLNENVWPSSVRCVQVLVELTRQVEQEKTFLSFSICHLGAEGKKRSFDLSVTSYLQRVMLDYCDLPGSTDAISIII